MSVGKNGNLNVGVSLVGVLVASALLGILAVFFSQLLNDSLKEQKSVRQSFDFQSTTTLLAMALRDPDKCPLALQDSSGNPVVPPNPDTTTFDVADIPISKIVVGTSTIVDTTTVSDSITVTSINLTQVIAGNPNTSDPYTMKINIVGSKGANALGGSTILGSIPISVTIAPLASPVITSCSTGLVATTAPASNIVLYRRKVPYNTSPVISDLLGVHKFCSINAVGTASDSDANYACSVTPSSAPIEFYPSDGNTTTNGAVTTGTGIESYSVTDAPPISWVLHSKCQGSCWGYCSAICID